MAIHLITISSPIKERILMLTKRHKNRVVAAILAVVLTLSAVGCSFIGPKATTEPVDDTPDLPSSITTAQTTAAEEENTPAVAENLVRVHSNEGNLLIGSIQIPTEPFEYELWQYDASHYLCLTYDQIEPEGYKEYAYLDLHLHVMDAKAGTIAADCAIDGSYNLHSIHYTDKGCILYGWADTAFHVVYENGTLSVETTERPTYPVVNDCPIVSANGAYTVYTTAEDAIGAGVMTVRYADGSVKALLHHKNAGDIVDGESVDIGDVERYHPIGFVDDTRFVYSIIGWEYSKGYGVYDLQTGENTKYLQAMSVCGVYDGKVYLTQNVDYETVAWWMCDPDGSDKTIIASVKPEDAVFTLSNGMYNYTYGFAGGVWFFHYAGNTTLYAHDFTETLAVITYSHKGSKLDNLLICENTVTAVLPYTAETEDAEAEVPRYTMAMNSDAVSDFLFQMQQKAEEGESYPTTYEIAAEENSNFVLQVSCTQDVYAAYNTIEQVEYYGKTYPIDMDTLGGYIAKVFYLPGVLVFGEPGGSVPGDKFYFFYDGGLCGYDGTELLLDGVNDEVVKALQAPSVEFTMQDGVLHYAKYYHYAIRQADGMLLPFADTPDEIYSEEGTLTFAGGKLTMTHEKTTTIEDFGTRYYDRYKVTNFEDLIQAIQKE